MQQGNKISQNEKQQQWDNQSVLHIVGQELSQVDGFDHCSISRATEMPRVNITILFLCKDDAGARAGGVAGLVK